MQRAERKTNNESSIFSKLSSQNEGEIRHFKVSKQGGNFSVGDLHDKKC